MVSRDIIYYTCTGRGDLASRRCISFNILNRTSEIRFSDVVHDTHTSNRISLHTSHFKIRWTVSQTFWYAQDGFTLLALVADTSHNFKVAVTLTVYLRARPQNGKEIVDARHRWLEHSDRTLGNDQRRNLSDSELAVTK
jgi:hypothetical protein